MNNSYASVKVVAASRNKSVSGLKAEVQTTSRFHGANAQAMPISSDGGVTSSDKKKMERLVVVMKRLATLAKEN